VTGRLSASGLALVGLSVACVGLAAVAIVSTFRPGVEVNPPSLEATSIDLTTGSDDGTLSAFDLIPGDAVPATIVVANAGSNPITYGMRRGRVYDGGGPLAAALQLTIRAVGTSCADFDGAVLFDGRLSEAAFGRDGARRPLAAATADILCLRVALPPDTNDSLQGAATTIVLSFDASPQAFAE
jgi:hypothetical protein